MKRNRRGVALLCAALLALLLAFPAAHAARDSFLFLGLNDKLALPLSTQTMPIYSGGVYYVAYNQFEYNTTKVDLSISIAAQKNSVSVYTKQQMLTFDLASGTCRDKNGDTLDLTPAIMRGGVIYLPVGTVCSYFSDVLSYSTLSTEYGTVIRIKSPYAVLDDESFRSGAEAGSLGPAVAAYLKAQEPTPTATPVPTPGVSPTPTPSPSASPGVDRQGVPVYLSFRCEDGGDSASILDALDRAGLSAAFFFRPDALYANDAVIRRMVGAGHVVGLLVPGADAEDALAALETGQAALELIAHTRTRTALLEDSAPPAAEQVMAEGWSLWRSDLTLSSSGTYASAAQSLLRAAESLPDRVRLELDCSTRSAGALPRILEGLAAQKYSIRLAVETELP